MSRNAWAEGVEQTQLILQESPDYCFLCGELVPDTAPDALIQAFLDGGHQQRLAVVCGRRACRLTLQDPAQQRWQHLFDALTHWPDRAIYPHGPYWVIRRPHQLTFRTDLRRTTVSSTASPADPDDQATMPSAEPRPAAPRPLYVSRARPLRRVDRQPKRR